MVFLDHFFSLFFLCYKFFSLFHAANQPTPAGGAAAPHEPNSSKLATSLPFPPPWVAAAAAAAAATVEADTAEPPSAETRAG